MTSKIIAAAAAVVGVSMAAAACTEAPTSSRATPAGDIRALLSPGRAERPAPPGGARRPRREAAGFDARRTFGPGCGILHHGGPGSTTALATAPVAAALGQEPGLSEMAHALQRAGLTRMLNEARALTVFAPDNAAFDALGAGNLQALLGTLPDLARVMRSYVVAGRPAATELARRHVVSAVAGTKLYFYRSGRSLGVNNATVTCGNVQTSNATVYVVDRMIVPGG